MSYEENSKAFYEILEALNSVLSGEVVSHNVTPHAFGIRRSEDEDKEGGGSEEECERGEQA